MGGLGRGGPLWIFFAFVFNAVWEKSTPMPPSRSPDGPPGPRRMLLPQRLLLELTCHWDQAQPHHRTRPLSSPLLCKVILVVHKI